MEFRILGRLEAVAEGRSIGLGGSKQRAVLALLLLARGRPVSSQRLIAEIWDGFAPDTAHKSVQVYVSALRKLLGDERIVTRDRGYALILEAGELDLDRFEALVAEVSGAPPATAAATLRSALALFRGPALDDLSLEPWAQPEIARLEERRLLALEKRIDADLELGRHRDVVAELEQIVAEHPYREHVLGQLMTALYRSGRQADALDVYRRAASRLRNELGLVPSRALMELEQRLLRQDPSLDRDEPSATRVARSRRGWRLIVLGGALIALAALAAAVVSSERGATASLGSLQPGVAVVDLRTNRVVSTIPMATMSQPVEANSGADSFWVASLNPYLFTRVDPRSGKITKRIGSPFGAKGAGYLADGASIWFTGIHDLVRFDTRSGLEVDRHTLAHRASDFGLVGLARGAGSLWIADNSENQLLRIDPASGRVLHRIPIQIPWGVAFGEGAVWVTSNATGVLRVDPETNRVTATALVPSPVTNVAVGGGFAWATNETKGAVYKIDQRGTIVATYQTGGGARDVAFADGRLWVVNQDAGSVTGIDPSTGDERVLRFGYTLNSMAAIGHRLLVVLNPAKTYEDEIAATKGKVARLIVPIYKLSPPDPAFTPSEFAAQVQRATCASLLRYPDAPPPAGFVLQPELATVLPSVSPDRRTYTFDVRRGYRFAPPSNAPVTAAAIRYGIERALSPRLGANAPAIAYLPDLQGAVAYHAGRRSHISGIHVSGRRISLSLTAASADFLERLSLPYFCPVPLDTPIVEGGLQDLAPPGAGPYTMLRAFNGEYTILKRNPNYHGPRPHALDAIAFREGIDDEIAVGRVEKQTMDAVTLESPSTVLAPSGALAQRWGPGSSASRRGDQRYHATPLRQVGYLALNAGRPLFRRARVRRAVARALDRSALAEQYGLIPTSQLLPPGVRSYQPTSVARPARRISRIVPAGTVAKMIVQSGCLQCHRVAAIVAASLAPLGIRVQQRDVSDQGTLLRTAPTSFDLLDWGTGLRYPDPASFLRNALLHDLPRSWLPPAIIAPLEALDRLSGPHRDQAAIRLARRFATREVPIIAYGLPMTGTLVAPRLGCLIWTQDDTGIDLASLCLR